MEYDFLGKPTLEFCRSTAELVDEEGVVHFYSCNREPGHRGEWHTGYEFGPHRDMSVPNESQFWPVDPQSVKKEHSWLKWKPSRTLFAAFCTRWK